MVLPDYYRILELKRNATLHDIRRAYFLLAKKYHPDINHEIGAQEKFQEINLAHQVLSDPIQKAKYDQRYILKEKNPNEERTYTDFRKYGTRVRDDDFRKYYENTVQEEETRKKTWAELLFTDTFLFSSLLFLGIITILLGLSDIFLKERKPDEPVNYYSLLFGLVFTLILLYGWRIIKPRK